MNTLLLHGWTWNPLALATLATGAAAYYFLVGGRGRPALFVTAILLASLALFSPLNTLARGVLFAAHMAQHILLLLIVPALLVLSLPRDAAPSVSPRHRATLSVALGWLFGIGAMWFWHIPQYCDAAATHAGIHAIQTLSLIGAGTAFWWPLAGPRASARLSAGPSIGYLFTACLACTALGILLTLTSVEICPAFSAPLGSSPWAEVRARVSPGSDQQIGGLLMWLPMCTVYLIAILIELARWFGRREALPVPAVSAKGNP